MSMFRRGQLETERTRDPEKPCVRVRSLGCVCGYALGGQLVESIKQQWQQSRLELGLVVLCGLASLLLGYCRSLPGVMQYGVVMARLW